MSEYQGIGLGLRYDLAADLLEQKPTNVRWLEIHPENYLQRGGKYAKILERAQEHWNFLTHGLTSCLGSPEPFDAQYLKDLKFFLKNLGTPWHSEHLCFGGLDGQFIHDLIPLPFTQEAAELAATRTRQMRDALDLPVAIENVSYYAPQTENGLQELDFLVEVAQKAEAKILLDVNNVYVNSKNFGFDALDYLRQVPVDLVVQLHIAGHLVRPDGLRIDTHGEAICDEVYALLEYTLTRFDKIPVLLERDNNIPAFSEIVSEVDRLTAIYDRTRGMRRAS